MQSSILQDQTAELFDLENNLKANQPDAGNFILKKMERKERKRREENLMNDPDRLKLIKRGDDFLSSLKFFTDITDAK